MESRCYPYGVRFRQVDIAISCLATVFAGAFDAYILVDSIRRPRSSWSGLAGSVMAVAIVATILSLGLLLKEAAAARYAAISAVAFFAVATAACWFRR